MSMPESTNGDAADSNDCNSKIVSAVKVMQILCMGLIGGLVCLSLVALLLPTLLNGPVLDNPLFAYVYFGLSVWILIGSQVGVHFAIKTMRSKLSSDADLDAKLGQYQTELLLRFGPLEGVGVFTLIGYIQMQQAWMLVLIPVLLAVMIVLLPNVQKFEAWCQRLSA